MNWIKYQHIERLGTDAVDGILDGRVYIFSKLDGTCTGVFMDIDGNVRVDNRNRLLSVGSDNAGSCAYVLSQEKFKKYLDMHPNHYLYGEWLVPHTIRSYEDTAWRKLYIFDVVEKVDEENYRYMTYEEYVPLLKEFGIEYIPVLCILDNPTVNDIINLRDSCTFLVKDNQSGEGCVIKNYSYKNKYGHSTWAKVVRPQHKISHKLKIPVNVDSIEHLIVDDLCTPEFIEKEFAKIVNENNGTWNSKMIPKFLGIVWHTFILEESWNMIKKYKMPTINYNVLRGLVIDKIKEVKQNLF